MGEAHRSFGSDNGRIAGLDGLRALAVTAVVAFHLWPASVPGGFLGVSLFFTLSGYLITSRLEHERTSTGTVDIRRFWGRRARRLLPASLACLLLVAIAWSAAGWMTDDIGRNIVAALANVANWFQIARHDAYGVDLDASPVLHFWSLAIEEQIYLVLPLVAFAFRGRRSRLVAFVVLLAGTVAATVGWSGNATVVYYSTFTRAGEVLAGAVAALIVHRWRPRRSSSATIVAGAGLIVLLWAVARTSLATRAYYSGGLLGIGVVSAVTVVAVGRSAPLGRILDVRPLAVLGRISYGVYLVHWPLLLGLRRVGLDGWALPASVVAGTVAIAWVSDRYYETPIRRVPAMSRRVPLLVAGGLATASLIVAVALLPASRPASAGDDLNAGRRIFTERLVVDGGSETADVAPGAPVAAGPMPDPNGEEPSSAVASTGPSVAPPVPGAAPARPRVAIFGDSKAIGFGLGMVTADDPRLTMVGGSSEFACPLGRSDEVRADADALPTPVAAACAWDERWPSVAADRGPFDVALVYFGTWDVLDQRVGALGDDWTHIGDPAFDDWLLAEMREATELLLTSSRHVVWLTVSADTTAQPAERFERYDALLAELANTSGPGVQVLDLGGWLESTGELPRLLPDGVHVTWQDDGGTAAEIGDRYLVPEILRIAAT